MTDTSRDVPIGELAGSGPRLTARPLPRRTVLRGAGVALALPWLEAMASAAPGAAKAPKRLVYVYVPNGVKLDQWRTALPTEQRGRWTVPLAGEHALEELPPLMRPLAAHRDRLTMLRGLAQVRSRANGDGPGDHARASAVWLTGIQPLKSEGRVALGVSADQLVAQEVGGATRIRSLVLGTERGRASGQCDSGYACAYSNNVSWESATTPAAKEVDPRRAFDRLFRGGDGSRSAEERRARLERRRSLLDHVSRDAKALSKRLSAEDRARIDEYETGLRELERQLSFDGAAHEDSAPDAARPDGAPRTFREQSRLLGEVLALALRADVTRVATLMYGNEGSGRRYTEVDVSGAHHALSHHGNDPEKLESIRRINQLHAECFASLVNRLAELEDARGGSVLDSTMLLYGSGIAEGNRHDHHDLPLALIAGRRTKIRGGRVLSFAHETPLNDLHLELMGRMGVKGVDLGDGRGPLPL